MRWTAYTTGEKREGLDITLRRLKELGRDDLAKIIAVLEQYARASTVDYRAAAAGVYDATGGFTDLDRDLAWALMPFLVRAHDMRGGAG